MTRTPASASADRESGPSPDTPRLVISFLAGVRTYSVKASAYIVAALVVNAAPWAAAGEIPSAAQASNGYYVSGSQGAMVIVFLGIVALLPSINILRGWVRGGEDRNLGPQPFEIRLAAEYAKANHEHPHVITKPDYEKIAAACALERRHAFESAKEDREAVQRQIDHLGTSIRAELKEQNAHAEERANELHGRITSFVGPLDALRSRIDDHIHDARAHTKGNHS